jgi:two-component system sensor histidine kinase SenX3
VAIGARLKDDVVEVTVADQGQGIPREEQERIFERFYRVDAARSRATGGTGLGLSIVKHVAANHGGEVTVWSEPGRGSTFTMRLPAAVDHTRRAGAGEATEVAQ